MNSIPAFSLVAWSSVECEGWFKGRWVASEAPRHCQVGHNGQDDGHDGQDQIINRIEDFEDGQAALMTKPMYEDHHHEDENESNGDDGVDDQG